MSLSAISEGMQQLLELRDYFNVDSGDAMGDLIENEKGFTKKESQWENPYPQSAIKPYLPQKNLVEEFNSQIRLKFLESSSPQESFLSCQEITISMLNNLDLKALLNCSEVNKKLYLATKVELVWENQLKKFLPQVEAMPEKECSFTSEQQFMIIFKRIHDEKRSWMAKFNRNQEICLKWKNKLQEIDEKYQKLGADKVRARIEEARQEIYAKAPHPRSYMEYDKYIKSLNQLEESEDSKAVREYDSHFKQIQKKKIQELSGEDYDGTIESIGKKSKQGYMLLTIQKLSDGFNNQEQFNQIIGNSQSIGNALISKINLVAL
jgi:hypothetical protein